jgi:hypothetical protein
MRFFPIILLLPLLTGCVPFPGGYVKIWPYSSERSAEISGTLLDERTQTPVAGAEVFFTYYPKLRDTSDRNGNFKISATRYHYWTTWCGAGGEVTSQNPPMSSDIMISHTNWASQRFQWDASPKTVILQKLPEASAIRPWMIFDGNGVVLQDGGAVQYLSPRPVQTSPGITRGAIYFGPCKEGGAPCRLHPEWSAVRDKCQFCTKGLQPTVNCVARHQ